MIDLQNSGSVAINTDPQKSLTSSLSNQKIRILGG